MNFKPFFENHFNNFKPFHLSTTNGVEKSCGFEFNRIEAFVIGFHEDSVVLRIFTEVFLATCALYGSQRQFDSVLVPFEGESLEELIIDALYERSESPEFDNPDIDFMPYLTKVFTRADRLNVYATQHAFKIKTYRNSEMFNRASVQLLGFNNEDKTAYINANFYFYLSSGVLLGGQSTPSVKMLEIPTRGPSLEELVFSSAIEKLHCDYKVSY